MALTGPIVQLKATNENGEAAVFKVHQDILCRSSEFFRRAMKPEWTNNDVQDNRVIDLSEDSSEALHAYLNWLYFKYFNFNECPPGNDTMTAKLAGTSKKASPFVHMKLAEAYVFGEKIMDVKYKNVVMLAIHKCIASEGCILEPMSAEIVFRGTPPASPLRRLIAVMIAYYASEDKHKRIWMDLIDVCPKEDLKHAMKVLVRIRKPTAFPSWGVAPYLEEE